MATKFSGTKSEIASLDTFIKLMRAVDTVMKLNRKELDKKGLTPSQFGILEALLHLGPLTQNQLGQKILKSGGNITKVVDNLEKRTFVTRRKDPDDRRSYFIELTPGGRKLIKKIFPSHVKSIEITMSSLSNREQLELQFLLKKLGTGKKKLAS